MPTILAILFVESLIFFRVAETAKNVVTDRSHNLLNGKRRSIELGGDIVLGRN